MRAILDLRSPLSTLDIERAVLRTLASLADFLATALWTLDVDDRFLAGDLDTGRVALLILGCIRFWFLGEGRLRIDLT